MNRWPQRGWSLAVAMAFPQALWNRKIHKLRGPSRYSMRVSYLIRDRDWFWQAPSVSQGLWVPRRYLIEGLGELERRIATVTVADRSPVVLIVDRRRTFRSATQAVGMDECWVPIGSFLYRSPAAYKTGRDFAWASMSYWSRVAGEAPSYLLLRDLRHEATSAGVPPAMVLRELPAWAESGYLRAPSGWVAQPQPVIRQCLAYQREGGPNSSRMTARST